MASYDVEEILDSRKKGKVTEYLVRWSPSWESEKNLNCSKLIKEFKAKSGDSDADNANGDADEDSEEEESQPTGNKRVRKAATAANRKRKAVQKTPKKGKSSRSRRR